MGSSTELFHWILAYCPRANMAHALGTSWRWGGQAACGQIAITSQQLRMCLLILLWATEWQLFQNTDRRSTVILLGMGGCFPHTRGLGILIGITIKESSVLQQNGFVCIALHADDSTLQEEFEILLGNRPMLHLWTDACPVVHLVNVALWPNLSAAYCHQTTCYS